MGLIKSLLSPEVVASLAGLLLTVIGLIVTVALPILPTRIYRWMGLRIEEKHMKALHEAISTLCGLNRFRQT